MANSRTPAELKNWKLKNPSPIWASSSISRKRQTTGFEPLHHIIYIYKLYQPMYIYYIGDNTYLISGVRHPITKTRTTILRSQIQDRLTRMNTPGVLDVF